MYPTRRHLLAGLLSVSGLSGCLSAESDADERPPESTDSESTDPEGTDEDPTVLEIRSPNNDPIITETTEESTSEVRHELVTDSNRIDELDIATGVSDEDRETIRTLLEATEYDSETVFITHFQIESCYRYQIQSVSWDGTDIEYEYCEELRPPDVSCTSDTWETSALLFRIPATGRV